MFDKLQKAFWKALTPDLVVDTPDSTGRAERRIKRGHRRGAGRCG